MGGGIGERWLPMLSQSWSKTLTHTTGIWRSLWTLENIWRRYGSPSFPLVHLPAARGAAEHCRDLLPLSQDLLLQVTLSPAWASHPIPFPSIFYLSVYKLLQRINMSLCLRWCLKLYCLVLAGLGLFLAGVWVIFQLYVLSQTTIQELRQQR